MSLPEWSITKAHLLIKAKNFTNSLNSRCSSLLSAEYICWIYSCKFSSAKNFKSSSSGNCEVT